MNNLAQKDEDLIEKRKRLISIDVFKGLTILLMVFVNTVGQYDNIPAWSKHAPDYGLTYVDLVAPFFIFMMALNFKPSYKHRLETKGRLNTYLRFLRRYLTFIGLGLIFSLNKDSTGFSLQWGTLQVLGLSGLILLPLIELKPQIRLIFACIGMTIHQFLLESDYGEIIFDAIEGGIFGMLSWGSMIILSSVLAEGLLNKNLRQYFFGGGIICIALGFMTSFIWGISRFRISAPFILISVGAASLLFYGLYLIFEIWSENYEFLQKENFLSVVGKNSFIMYFLHILLILIAFAILPFESHVLLVFTWGLANVLIIWLISYFFYKEDILIII